MRSTLRLLPLVSCVAALLLVSCGGEKATETETIETVQVSSTQPSPTSEPLSQPSTTTSVSATTNTSNDVLTGEEIAAFVTEGALGGFAEVIFYSGWPVPAITQTDADCIGEYVADEYVRHGDNYLDADELSVGVNLAMYSCLDIVPHLASSLAADWQVSDDEAECVVETIFETFPIEVVAAIWSPSGEVDGDQMEEVLRSSECLTEAQIDEIFAELPRHEIAVLVVGDGTAKVEWKLFTGTMGSQTGPKERDLPYTDSTVFLEDGWVSVSLSAERVSGPEGDEVTCRILVDGVIEAEVTEIDRCYIEVDAEATS